MNKPPTLDEVKSWHKQGKLQAAKQGYLAILAVYPHEVDAYYNLALIFTKIRQIENAMNVYHALIALSPKHAGAHFQLGCLFMQQEQFQTAISHFLFL